MVQFTINGFSTTETKSEKAKFLHSGISSKSFRFALFMTYVIHTW